MYRTPTDKNIARYNFDRYDRKDGQRICLQGLLAAKPTTPATEEKRERILYGLTETRTRTSIGRVCSIGTCEVSIVDDTQAGRTVAGECVATNYCLKEKFEESGDDSKSPDER